MLGITTLTSMRGTPRPALSAYAVRVCVTPRLVLGAYTLKHVQRVSSLYYHPIPNGDRAHKGGRGDIVPIIKAGVSYYITSKA